ncbi:MAG: prsA [Candidatus Aminicenantes bacterium]|jgi:parvulin-like peptidyl-prolyl isomerase|nr:prsA [Candidatus Aminicenantes bacterium]
MKTLACFVLIALAALPASSGIQDKAEPEHITVQHILIAFKGSLPDPKVTRSQADAETLALKIFERAKAGEDFDAMVKTYTNDAYPGIYKMSNRDVAPGSGEFPRTRMVKAFGDVGFGLEVGGVGLAVYDPGTSKYGWHIIKRLE